jgi:hypothetical protein
MGITLLALQYVIRSRTISFDALADHCKGNFLSVDLGREGRRSDLLRRRNPYEVCKEIRVDNLISEKGYLHRSLMRLKAMEDDGYNLCKLIALALKRRVHEG